MSRVKEIVNPLGFVIKGLWLGEFIGVVRELEIHPAGVDVHRVREYGGRHGWAFDVPARATWSERRVPRRLVLLAFLPEHKVLSWSLVVLELRQSAFALVKQFLVLTVARLEDSILEFSIFLVRSYVEINTAVRLIRETVCDRLFNKLYNLGNILCHSR